MSPSFAADALDSIGICHQVGMLGNANITWAYTVGEGNWKTLEPTRGNFIWTALDDSIKAAHDAGKKIWIQVLTDDPSGTIPQWALDAGMRQFPSEWNINEYFGVLPNTKPLCTGPNIPLGCCTQGMPVQWGPENNNKYLIFLQEILTAMAARYDNSNGNNDAIEAILMMSGGHYGEMSLHGDNPIRQAYLNEMSLATGVSVADLERRRPSSWSGINRIPPALNDPRYLFDQKYVEHVFKLIDMYAATFRSKPVVLQLGTTSMWNKLPKKLVNGVWVDNADGDSTYVALNAMNYAANKYGSHVWFKQNGMGNSQTSAYSKFFSLYNKPAPAQDETRFIFEVGHWEAMCYNRIGNERLGTCWRGLAANSDPVKAQANWQDACNWNTSTINDAVNTGGVSAICFQSQFFAYPDSFPCIFPGLQARLVANGRNLPPPPVIPTPTPGATPTPVPPIVPVTPPPSDPWEYLPPGPSAENRSLNTVGDFLGLGINIVLGVALGISLIAIILAGIKFITSRGDPKATAAAQQALTYAVVAFILTIGAFTLKEIIFNVVGGNYGDLRNATPHF